MPDFLLTALVFIAWMAFATKRLMTYLHILQQDDYDNARLMRWIFEYRVFDKRLSAMLLIIGFLSFFIPHLLTALLLVLAFGWTAYNEKDPRQSTSKKKLVMTQRARRIFFFALALAVILGLWSFVIPLPLLWILSVQMVPAALFLANILLIPVEKSIQKKFWNEAHAKLLTCNPKIIGITGSFGKTSVKHILGHILKTQAPTLITPGSVNTPMGITRIIREQLEDNHKYFIVEMGAYGPGSIARLCDLVPPDMGIITAIGHAHYERFKTLETVAQAKFELAEAVLKKNGKIIVHEAVLEQPYAAQIKTENLQNFITCGEDALHTEQTEKGLRVKVIYEDASYTIEAPLYGLHHGGNIALAFVAAINLGIPAENIITALKSTPQITHRLEVKPQADGRIFIDDAFNSNPKGFRAALELLDFLGKNRRKILITPGMVELGEAHATQHQEIGKIAGEICDVVIAVNPGRIRNFTNAIKNSGAQLIEVARFTEAAEWLEKNKKPGDVILIENDLPDLYERIPKI